ncbi:hypothetical protein GOV12_00810 [Candidatus Pacearchaeota archaeon]|nr:hypothetical protein [Candidatus Pacearchaeota archaeon]
MKKGEIIFLVVVSIIVFLVIYSPHFSNRFPLHLDEWHHITEAMNFRDGNYEFVGRDGYITKGFEIGFHILLVIFSLFFNLIFSYQYLAGIFGVISSLILFFVVYKKSGSYSLGIFSMIFFASIKTNANLLGLNYFVPLTFAIPFIFLYLYFFSEGLRLENKKYIIYSILIMTGLLFFHSVSVLFAIPILIIYSLFYLKYIKKEYKFFMWFLIVVLVGILFYFFMEKVSIVNLFPSLISDLEFKYGWGVYEINNSFFEVYSLIGYIFAGLGLYELLINSKIRKKYLVFIIYPLYLLLIIFIFKIFKTSFLSPFQRNLYYFVLGMPVLSAFGLKFVYRIVIRDFEKFEIREKLRKNLKLLVYIIIIVVVLFFSFYSYNKQTNDIKIYQTIDEKSFKALEYLKQLPTTTIMTPLINAPAVYPISGHKPVGTIWFYGNELDVRRFYAATNCEDADNILKEHEVKYILTQIPFSCNWTIIYEDKYFIYERDFN